MASMRDDESVPLRSRISQNLRSHKDLAQAAGPVGAKAQVSDEIGSSQAAPAAEQEGGLSPERKKLIGQALIAFAPILAGAAFGGSQGGAIGAQAGQSGLQSLEKAEEAEAVKSREEQLFGLEQSKIGMQREHNQAADKIAQMKAGDDKRQAQIDLGNKLRVERNALPTTKQTQDVSVAYQKISSAVEDPSAAGDLSVIFSYMKMLDPGSTVREGEFANAQNAAGVPVQIQNQWNRLMRGERLAPEQRADFANQASKLYAAQQDVQSRVDSQYAVLASKAGVPPESVIVNFEPGVAVAARDQKAQQQAVAQPSRQALGLPGTPAANAAPVPSISKPDFKSMSNEELKKYIGR